MRSCANPTAASFANGKRGGSRDHVAGVWRTRVDRSRTRSRAAPHRGHVSGDDGAARAGARARRDGSRRGGRRRVSCERPRASPRGFGDAPRARRARRGRGDSRALAPRDAAVGARRRRSHRRGDRDSVLLGVFGFRGWERFGDPSVVDAHRCTLGARAVPANARDADARFVGAGRARVRSARALRCVVHALGLRDGGARRVLEAARKDDDGADAGAAPQTARADRRDDFGDDSVRAGARDVRAAASARVGRRESRRGAARRDCGASALSRSRALVAGAVRRAWLCARGGWCARARSCDRAIFRRDDGAAAPGSNAQRVAARGDRVRLRGDRVGSARPMDARRRRGHGDGPLRGSATRERARLVVGSA